MNICGLDLVTYLDRPGFSSQSPESRPRSADTTGHVLNVKNEKTLVVLRLSLETYAFTTNVAAIRAVQRACVVDAEDSVTVLIADILLLLGCLAVDIPVRCQQGTKISMVIILYETVGRLISLGVSDEVEVIEEGGAGKSVRL